MLNIRPENLIGGVAILLLSLILMLQAPILGTLGLLFSLAVVVSGSKNMSEESMRIMVAGLLVAFILVSAILGLANQNIPKIVGPDTDPLLILVLFSGLALGCWLVYKDGEISENPVILMGFVFGLYGTSRFIDGSIIASSVFVAASLLLIIGGIRYKSARR